MPIDGKNEGCHRQSGSGERPGASTHAGTSTRSSCHRQSGSGERPGADRSSGIEWLVARKPNFREGILLGIIPQSSPVKCVSKAPAFHPRNRICLASVPGNRPLHAARIRDGNQPPRARSLAFPRRAAHRPDCRRRRRGARDARATRRARPANAVAISGFAPGARDARATRRVRLAPPVPSAGQR